MKLTRFFVLLAALAVFAFLANPDSGQTFADSVDSVQADTQNHDTTAPVDVVRADVIVEEIPICNVADRVTETVERRQSAAIRLPDAPAFAIGHVPLTGY